MTDAAQARLAELLERARYEVLPLDGMEDAVLEHVPRTVKLTVTVSPVKGLENTLAATERLAGHGYAVVPHVSARLVRDEAHLAEIVARLGDAGIREVFAVAGDAPEPAGRFEGAAQLLDALSRVDHPFADIGITGYPESHPFISDADTIDAMFAKAEHASYITSQICFDPRVTAQWIENVWARGTRLPIHVGIPGAVSTAKLLRVTTRIGLGESARFLRKHAGWVAKLLRPGAYDPSRLIRGFERLLADPERKLAGFHVFTFNDVAATERWRRATLRELGNGTGGRP
jgi:methylenetetrahydrofolate reductase (NADPH)